MHDDGLTSKTSPNTTGNKKNEQKREEKTTKIKKATKTVSVSHRINQNVQAMTREIKKIEVRYLEANILEKDGWLARWLVGCTGAQGQCPDYHSRRVLFLVCMGRPNKNRPQ